MLYRMSENKSVQYSLYLRNLLFPKIRFNVIAYLLHNPSRGHFPRIIHKAGSCNGDNLDLFTADILFEPQITITLSNKHGFPFVLPTWSSD
jgi:hypothetical protein